jgi:hypothetical protein
MLNNMRGDALGKKGRQTCNIHTSRDTHIHTHRSNRPDRPDRPDKKAYLLFCVTTLPDPPVRIRPCAQLSVLHKVHKKTSAFVRTCICTCERAAYVCINAKYAGMHASIHVWTHKHTLTRTMRIYTYEVCMAVHAKHNMSSFNSTCHVRYVRSYANNKHTSSCKAPTIYLGCRKLEVWFVASNVSRSALYETRLMHRTARSVTCQTASIGASMHGPLILMLGYHYLQCIF